MEWASSKATLSPTAKVARWSARHRWWVLAGSLLALVLATSTRELQLQDGDGGVGESAAGREVLDERFPAGTHPSEQLLISHPELAVEDPEYRAVAEVLYAELEALPQVLAIVSFYESGDLSCQSKRAGATSSAG